MSSCNAGNRIVKKSFRSFAILVYWICSDIKLESEWVHTGENITWLDEGNGKSRGKVDSMVPSVSSVPALSFVTIEALSEKGAVFQ